MPFTKTVGAALCGLCLGGIVGLSNQALAGEKTNQADLDAAVAALGAKGATLPYEVMRSDIPDAKRPGKTIEIRNGGYGSAMAPHPAVANQFYVLTDRGPNGDYKGEQGKGKIFPDPDYTPRIGLFELQKDGSVKLLKAILLRRPDGTPITGLPNLSGLGGTGETPYQADGKPVVKDPSKPYNDDKASPDYNPIRLDEYGLDGEGLVALSDGTFWVSDEYGPHIVHFDAEGKEIGRINAFAKDERSNIKLPAEFAHRRANRGMEGLAVTPDEKTLAGVMQSAMHNPDKSVQKLDLTRIVTVNLTTGAVSQYLYKQDKPANSNSELAGLPDGKFLIIERDGAFASEKPKAQKKVFRIDLSTGTDLEKVAAAGTSQDEALGLLIDGKTVEQAVLDGGWEALAAKGIKPVDKVEVLDMVAATGYPHDKMEGLWVMGKDRLGVVNDDDFALWSDDNKLEQKYLDEKTIDGDTLYVVTIKPE